jgi:hypothetical protein
MQAVTRSKGMVQNVATDEPAARVADSVGADPARRVTP